MLTQLTINNFAIVRDLDIDFFSGMTAITGETGAGKSIAIDALGLCLGNRSDATAVRHQALRADICARFSLHDAPQAAQWLEKNHFDHQECLLRRVINNDGRSRGFINGTAVPIAQLRELGQLLIQVHGQHDHQLLLKMDHQRKLLDAFADQADLISSVQQAYRQWSQACQQLTLQQQLRHEKQARQQLLHYQLHELTEFMPQAGEFEQLEAEYKRLSNSGNLLTLSQRALEQLADNEDTNILRSLHMIQHDLIELGHVDPQFNTLNELLASAAIQIHEVSDELRRYADKVELNPSRQLEIEQRLSQQIHLARKHHVRPEDLYELYQQLQIEQQQLLKQNDDIERLTRDVEQYYLAAQEVIYQLHLVRKQYAEELSHYITTSMHQLSMPHGQFVIEVVYQPEQISPYGSDKVEFLVTTNPGQPLQPLDKVASGGELSRIALAIQVITAKKMDTPALIFDEVDTGVSGETAALIGQQLQELSHSVQVITVTHLPQVAGKANHHFHVSKQNKAQETHTTMERLDKEGRLHELARLLSSGKITSNTLANAKELLISD